jgi:serine/threonine protein kinase
MPGIAGFTINGVLHLSERTLVVRAVRDSDDRAVVLKSGSLMADDAFDRSLVREFELGKDIRSPRIPEYLELVEHDYQHVLVEQDGEMPSLSLAIPQRGFDLARFFVLAIEIVAALEDLHRAGVIHRDIHPANIIADPIDGEVMLIDLRLAGRADEEVPDFVAPTQLQDSVAYISPEHTGRVDRPVDARSDLYSLGITLFQMLTGRLPFAAITPAEIMDCHLAKEPPSPLTIQGEAPPGLGLCIDKLLRKSPDERYQSAASLRADLERLRQAYIDTGSSPADFRPGEDDQPA